ncbi:hypothetical protein VNO77_31446 [Canavalia gladiata]|uniref:Uncharacterized protein n=1 Tax=Canavalia gladiata TaxID=3824 RepID=A0AAN9Q7Q3_CANGL
MDKRPVHLPGFMQFNLHLTNSVLTLHPDSVLLLARLDNILNNMNPPLVRLESDGLNIDDARDMFLNYADLHIFVSNLSLESLTVLMHDRSAVKNNSNLCLTLIHIWIRV